MEYVFILFECDAWHSHESKSRLGIFTDHAKAVIYADRHSKVTEEGELSKHDVLLLGLKNCGINQTQGRSQNYIIEKEIINPID